MLEITHHEDRHDSVYLGGVFRFECRDKDGNLKWVEETRNLVTNQGLDYLLNVLRNQTQIAAWYVIPFESDSTPAAGNTYATPSFTECTTYTEANRPAWTIVAPSAQQLTNTASKARFTFNASKTIYGAALVGGGTGATTKGNTAGGGTLLCASRFATSKAVESSDTLDVTYTFSAATA
jgi:hypothetical protein